MDSITEIVSNQFSLICNVSRWFSFLNEVSIEEYRKIGTQVSPRTQPAGTNPCRLGSRGHLGADFSLLLYTDLVPCRLGSRGHLGADFSLLLYTHLIKKRKPSIDITDEGELIRHNKYYVELNL